MSITEDVEAALEQLNALNQKAQEERLSATQASDSIRNERDFLKKQLVEERVSTTKAMGLMKKERDDFEKAFNVSQAMLATSEDDLARKASECRSHSGRLGPLQKLLNFAKEGAIDAKKRGDEFEQKLKAAEQRSDEFEQKFKYSEHELKTTRVGLETSNANTVSAEQCHDEVKQIVKSLEEKLKKASVTSTATTITTTTDVNQRIINAQSKKIGDLITGRAASINTIKELQAELVKALATPTATSLHALIDVITELREQVGQQKETIQTQKDTMTHNSVVKPKLLFTTTLDNAHRSKSVQPNIQGALGLTPPKKRPFEMQDETHELAPAPKRVHTAE